MQPQHSSRHVYNRIYTSVLILQERTTDAAFHVKTWHVCTPKLSPHLLIRIL